MRQVMVVGVGIHKFGRFPGKSAKEMGRDAAIMALKDAGMEWKEMQAVFCGNTRAGVAAGNMMGALLGDTGVPIVTVDNACATAGSAFRLAYQSVAYGIYDKCLAVGFEKMPRGFIAPTPGVEDDDLLRFKLWGIPNPGYWAIRCRRHMTDYGTTAEQLGKISVKNHKNGVDNPYAMYQKEISLEEIMNSRLVCDPLRLLMMCAPDEGAAAAVLSTTKIARSHTTKPVTVVASEITSHVHAGSFELPDGSRRSVPMFPHPLTAAVAKKAYEASGLGPKDLNLVELQDTSSFGEIEYAEALGLCKLGEGGRLIDEGISERKGKLPISVSGGLLSKGEPIGASGLGQIFEVVTQLRGDAGPRQVANAKVGLAHTMGGAGNCSVVILKK